MIILQPEVYYIFKDKQVGEPILIKDHKTQISQFTHKMGCLNQNDNLDNLTKPKLMSYQDIKPKFISYQDNRETG